MRTIVAGFVLLLAACGSPTGAHVGATFSGTVSSSLGGGIASASVTVTPSAGAALAAVQTSASGAFTVDNVPAGDGTITVSNVPSNCSPTVSVQYTGAKNGGSSTHNIVVGCN